MGVWHHLGCARFGWESALPMSASAPIALLCFALFVISSVTMGMAIWHGLQCDGVILLVFALFQDRFLYESIFSEGCRVIILGFCHRI
jgi:hypothetical protein